SQREGLEISRYWYSAADRRKFADGPDLSFLLVTNNSGCLSWNTSLSFSPWSLPCAFYMQSLRCVGLTPNIESSFRALFRRLRNSKKNRTNLMRFCGTSSLMDAHCRRSHYS